MTTWKQQLDVGTPSFRPLNSLPRNLGGLCIGGLNKLAASVINGCLSALGHSEPEEGGILLTCNSDEPAAAAAES